MNADETIEGDVVALGGSADVRGVVHGDVVAIGGSVELGPGAEVSRDVVAVGGTISRDPSARVGGRIREIGMGGFDADGWQWPQIGRVPFWWGGWRLGSAFELMSTLIRAAVLALLAGLVVLLAQHHVGVVAARVGTEPLKAGAVGFLAQLLFLPIFIFAIVVLVLTIIGIPLVLLLVPFVLVGLALVALVGFTSVSYQLGRLLAARMGWSPGGPYAVTMIGLGAIVAPVLLGRLVGLVGAPLYPMSFGLGLFGLLVEYAAWTVGFGAMALTRFNRPPFNGHSPAAPAA